jgi:hypothetical protein
MAITDSANSLTISWNPSDISLADLKILTAYVADIDDQAARPWAISKLGSAPSSPLVTAIRMGSPLIAEIASNVHDGTVGVLTLGAVGYLIKHPEKLGGWVARFRAASYRDQRQKLIEKSEYLRTKAELEAYGGPILQFEREAAFELNLISPETVPYLESEGPEIEPEGPEIEPGM